MELRRLVCLTSMFALLAPTVQADSAALAPPAAVKSLAAWYDGSDISSLTLSSQTISRWNDKSGNGFTAILGASSMPTYNVATGLVSFSGTQGLHTPAFLAGDRTIFAVVTTTSTVGSLTSPWYSGSGIFRGWRSYQ
jgi:hypothetical protein